MIEQDLTRAPLSFPGRAVCAPPAKVGNPVHLTCVSVHVIRFFASWNQDSTLVTRLLSVWPLKVWYVLDRLPPAPRLCYLCCVSRREEPGAECRGIRMQENATATVKE